MLLTPIFVGKQAGVCSASRQSWHRRCSYSTHDYINSQAFLKGLTIIFRLTLGFVLKVHAWPRSVITAVFAWYYIPDSPEKARYLDARERKVATMRLKEEQLQEQVQEEVRDSTSKAKTSSTSTSKILDMIESSTTLKTHSTPPLDTSSVIKGLQIMYRSEGVPGLFRGVGPRAVWTAVQSGCMFMLYQSFLKWFEGSSPAI